MKGFIKKYKYYLILGIVILIFLIVMCVFAKDMFFTSGGDVYGNRLDGISENKLTTKETNTVKEELLKNEKVKEVKIRTQGKIVYLIIDFVKDTSLDNAKEIATKSLLNFDEKIKTFYDFNFSLTQTDNTDEESVFPTMGSKNCGATSIVWVNN